MRAVTRCAAYNWVAGVETVNRMEVRYDMLKGIRARHYVNLVKCPGCNWTANWLFVFAGRKFDEEGICADCFTHMIYELGYGVYIPEKPRRRAPAQGNR